MGRGAHAVPKRRIDPRTASLVLVGIGVILRCRQYAFDRSIWNDEALLAFNIFRRGFLGLTHPLASYQSAPIGFLWAQKVSTELFGHGSYALRLVPFLAGLIGLFLFRSIAETVIGGWAGCIAVALYSFSPSLVYYADEAKQYSVDVTAVLLILWLTFRVLDRAIDRRGCVLFGAVSAVTVWWSFPAAFAAGACSVVLFLATVRRAREKWPIVLGTALWLVSFAAEYAVSLRQAGANAGLKAFWTSFHAFAPRPLRATTTLHWVGSTVQATVHYPFDLHLSWLALIVLAAGFAWLLLRRRPTGMVFLLLSGAVVVAGIAGAYPVNSRLVLFLAPVAYLLVGGSTVLFGDHRARWAAIGLVVLISAPIFFDGANAVLFPYTRTEGKPAIAFALSHQGEHDAVLIEGTSVNLFRYYAETAGAHATGNIWTEPSTAGCVPPVSWLQHYQRLIVVYAPSSLIRRPADTDFAKALRILGPIQEERGWPGAMDFVIHVDPDPSYQMPRVPGSTKRECLGFYIYPT